MQEDIHLRSAISDIEARAGSAPGAIHRNVINLSNNFLFWQKMTIINFGTSHEKFRLES